MAVTIAAGATITTANQSSYSVTGACNVADVTVVVTLTGGSASAASAAATCTDSAWTATADASGLPDGTVTVTAVGTSPGETSTVVGSATKDTAGPVVSAPASITVDAASAAGTPASNATIVAFLAAATAADIVDGSVSVTNNAPSVFPIAATTVTFTAADSLGNTGTATAVVTVEDQSAPVITAPEATTITATDADGTARTATDVAAWLDSVTGLDNVDGELTGEQIGNDAPEVFPIGATTVKFFILDSSQLEGSATAVLTIADLTAPVVTPPASITVAATNANGTMAGDDLVSDGAFLNGSVSWQGGAAVAANITSYFAVAETTSGNVYDVNLSQVMAIVPDSAYTITFKAKSSIERTIIAGVGLNSGDYANSAESVSLTAEWQTFTLSQTSTGFGDDSSRVLFDMGGDQGGQVWLDDVSVKTSDGTELITNGGFQNGITGWSSGAAVAANITSYFAVAETTSGNVYDVNLSQTMPLAPGTSYTVMFKAKSSIARTMIAGLGLYHDPWTNAGESVALTTDWQTFTLAQTTTGFGDKASRILFDMGGDQGGQVWIDDVSVVSNALTGFLAGATATDNVDGALTVSNDGLSVFPLGETTVTFSATDAAENVGTESATVTITDQTAPVLTAPADGTVPATDANGTAATDPAIVAWVESAVATDNVDSSVTITNDAPAVLPLGATVVTFTVTDAAGNTSTATATATIADTTAPVITAPEVLVVLGESDGVSATTQEIVDMIAAVTATDNVDGVIATITNDAPTDVFPFGETTVTFTATDAAGNVGTAKTVVNVSLDIVDPVLTISESISINVDLPGQVVASSNDAVAAFFAAAVATDNKDGDLTASITNDGLTEYPVGVTVVTFSVSDAAGNTGDGFC